jgi:hypothetical protein
MQDYQREFLAEAKHPEIEGEVEKFALVVLHRVPL